MFGAISGVTVKVYRTGEPSPSIHSVRSTRVADSRLTSPRPETEVGIVITASSPGW